MNRIFCKNTSSDRSTNLCVLQDACHDLFCVFKDFYASRTQDTEVTKSLRIKLLLLSSPPLPEQQNLHWALSWSYSMRDAWQFYPQVPRVTNINFSLQYQYIFSNRGYENLQNDHQGKNASIFYHILLTNSLRKCMDQPGDYTFDPSIGTQLFHDSWLAWHRFWRRLHLQKS